MNTKKTKGCITLIIKQKWNRETKKKIEVKRKGNILKSNVHKKINNKTI